MSAAQLRLVAPAVPAAAPLPAAQPVAWPVPAAASPAKPRHRRPRDLGLFLLDEGVIAAHDLIRALALGRRSGADLVEVLQAHGMVGEAELTRALARFFDLAAVDPALVRADPRLIDRLGAEICLAEAILPLQSDGARMVVVVPRPELFLRHRARLDAVFGPVVPALAPRAAIQAAIAAVTSDRLASRALTRSPAAESCRTADAARGARRLALAAGGLALLALVAPITLFAALAVLAATGLMLVTGLKAAAMAASVRRPAPLADLVPDLAGGLPVVSVLVALYQEADIAPRLVARLGRLDYPRDRLDLVLAVEEGDRDTRAALDRRALPPWMRVITVPHGALRTKPRALNYALDFCRGSIVGVYDAEDAPAGDQLSRVVARFGRCGEDVACLQGVLDFYNPRSNWLSRCFTIEYAAWFRVVLPGLQRLGLPLPLGGTTLFFRRDVLERLGAWDAHNVTEDADLGIRLARHGYRTEMVETVTGEEANCASLQAWVRQRSRWIKGYMMTWAVHMRAPGRLWRDLGPRGFLGFQVLFLGALSQALLAPVLLSFWALSFGLPHPLAGALPAAVIVPMVGLFVLAEGVTLAIGLLALARSGQRVSPLWVPTLHLYHPFAALAAYKALWETACRPFFWDKTRHGLCDQVSAA
jgi:cellulose synthase/poly-beta-1,6-N-acetylglucosamine synthase-like glycosyltransferase